VFFALTTDPGDLVRTLMAHGGLRPRLGYSLFAAMQLAPELATELQQMRLARRMKSGRPLRRLPSPSEALSLVVPLLAFAIRRAGRIAIAMEARGLSPRAPRTYVSVPKFRARDAAFVAIALGVLCMSVTHWNGMR
jgi:energy-coupling factor transport system permease protein